MVTNINTLQSGTNGSSLPNPLITDGYGYTVAGLTYNAANAPFGKMCALTLADTTAGYFRATGLSITSAAVSFYFMSVGAVPTSDLHLINILVGATRVASVHVNAASKLRVSDATGTTGVWTATNALVSGHWYRGEFAWASGTGAADGTIKFDYYDLGTIDNLDVFNNTPVQAGYSATNISAGSGGVCTDIYIGKRSNVAFQMAFAAPAFAPGQTTYIGMFNLAAASPANPFAVRSNAGGFTLTGTGVNKVGALQDSNNSTYVTNAGVAADEMMQILMAPLSAGLDVQLHYTAWIPAGSTATKVKVRVLQGTTQIATETRTTTDVGTPLTGTPQSYTLTVPSASITDRAALRVELIGNAA